ncbi:glycerol-3-phosphate 1-O-acyltransferase PlsY [Sediminicurvatus halobius]|uniref:Glycerol-3-phosphate acyltransferase n=1 Tax=Sediminicurvatus halobius TaxID=2182432 RepID=A0A2U2N7G9_9GAMM|nr:glycerol-3-phosphate 1-O-acyltransferase PlsY [Spiribacter halobius]PWG64924.1 acyl-phosphate glycerol 3-phosphate acyltransferase [Spiribacter halobius]UEX78220.1 glycerol-3-phosphate 1-O-acyltransferase PlsY [Spiribacter halobius]
MLGAVLILFGYLCGSLSAAIIVARLMGLGDPREAGSGNPGTTNMLRLGGRTAAALTLLGDALKGVLPVLAAHLAGAAPWVLGATGLAAFIGHLYPVFFGFRGGKGVATGLGVIIAWAWPAGLATLGTWLAVAIVTRYASLSALVSFLIAPLYLVWLGAGPILAGAMAVMTALTYWRHRSNIANLLAGREGKISLSSRSKND